MRNLLEEFHGNHGIRPPTILGVREHVFTGRFGMRFLMIKYTLIFVSNQSDLSYPFHVGYVNAVSHH